MKKRFRINAEQFKRQKRNHASIMLSTNKTSKGTHGGASKPKKMSLRCDRPFSALEYQHTVALSFQKRFRILNRDYCPAALVTLASMLGMLPRDVHVPMFRLNGTPGVEYVMIRAETQHHNSHL